MSTEIDKLYEDEETQRAVEWAKKASLDELAAVVEKNRRDLFETTRRIVSSVKAVLVMHNNHEKWQIPPSPSLQWYRENAIEELESLAKRNQRQRELESILKERSSI